MRGISVVIPNYNGAFLLPETIPTVLAALYNTGLQYEIIISDDKSTDNSIEILRGNFPDVVIIENKKNEGFSITINKGIAAAKYQLILLLNSDVQLSVDYFERQLKYFDKTDTFGVMGRIIGWRNDKIQDGAKYPSFHGAKIKTTGNYLPLDENEGKWLYSMYLSGANALVDANKLKQLGGFDEIFSPFYVEDYELSVRAWRMGWKCYYEHHAICRHKESASIKSKVQKKYINTIYYRNKMYLHAIHLEGFTLFFWYLQLIPELVIRLMTFRFYYIKSIQLFFYNLSNVQISKKRFSTLNEGKKLSLPYVIQYIKKSLINIPIKKF